MSRHALVIFLSLIILSLDTGSIVAGPPVAPVRTVVDDYWGEKVEDPYRYMENVNDPEAREWIKAEADYADSVLGLIPNREKLLQQLDEVGDGRPLSVYRISCVSTGRIFYLRRARGESLARLYWQDGIKGEPHLLVDPSLLVASDGGHYSLYFYRPSPDGRYVVYGLSPSGSEDVTSHVIEVATGKDLPDVIDRIEPYYTPPQWLPDNSGFTYTRLQEMTAGMPETEGYKNSRTYLHRLGDEVANDQPVFAMHLYESVPMSEEDFPSIIITPESDYMLGLITHGDANEVTLYSAPLSALGAADAAWKLVCDVPDSVVDFAVNGNDVYLLTSLGAPHFRVLRTSLSDADIGSTVEVIPNGEEILTSLKSSRDALYIGTSHAGLSQILRLDYGDGTVKALQLLHGASSGYTVMVENDVEGVYIATNSWTERSATYAYDPENDSFSDTGLNPEGLYDSIPDCMAVEIEVPSHDGVMVPLSLIYRTDMKRDGSNPLLLTGYGSYGSIESPHFSTRNYVWLEQGGIVAVAHVRGGGENGQEWHLAGQKLNKPNTWKDFIACAEYLIREGYTSPEKLACQGGSAGGIVVGRAITDRPDLFAAAVIDVGDSDMLRAETTTNGIPNIQEFGTVTREDEFRGLLEMSSYHHVRDGVKYPAVLLTHGMNDPRVAPWNSAKMCARLQAASSSGKPVLFRVDYFAGHGIGSTKKQQYSETADALAFLLWQLGDPKFQP